MSSNGVAALTGTDLKAILQFDDEDNNPVLVRVGISPVSIEGAMNNLNNEIATWNFDAIRKQTKDKWNKQLSSISINDKDSKQKEIFYTSLYFASIYPQLYSDVTGEFRSSDCTVHKSNFRYFAGVLGLWGHFQSTKPLGCYSSP